MSQEKIQSYNIGDIEVVVTEAQNPAKVHIKATRGNSFPKSVSGVAKKSLLA